MAVCGLVAGLTLAKIVAASQWGLLADEAYYWVWSHDLDWGYYDQPAAIAWMMAIARSVSDAPLALRSLPLAGGLLASLVLLPHARDRGFWLLWSAGLPPFAVLTLFATPDAPLLFGWALCLSGALFGGAGWLIAGLGAALALHSKYTAVAVLPLAILGAGPKEWKSAWPWLGLGLALLLFAPHLVWSWQMDWVAFRFQLGEGLLHSQPPGGAGVLRFFLDQLGFVTPLAALAVAAWGVHSATGFLRLSREERICWFTAIPVALFFVVASGFAPPEAHWPIPAYLSAGLALSWARGPLRKLAEVGAWVGLLLTVLGLVHVFSPLVRFPTDPGKRVWQGPLLAEQVSRWAAQGAARAPVPVLTERYQEAALVHYYTGIRAYKVSACGREDQYQLWPPAPLGQAVFLRPTRSGPLTCLDRERVSGPHAFDLRDPHKRTVGSWQLWEVR